jgi:hypothetical protein
LLALSAACAALGVESPLFAQTRGSGAPVDALAGFDPVAIAAVGDVLTSCVGIPPGGFSGVTNDRFYFLSEVGGCENLPCFLAQVEGTEHANGTLVIDQQCVLSQPLKIPPRFTLAGVGANGEGSLVFDDLPDNTPAIRVTPVVFQQGVSHNVIRDLNINFTGTSHWNAGISVSQGNIVNIENVRLSGFAIGVYGAHAYSIKIENSVFYDNAFNLMLHEGANHWRVRDSVIGRALYGVKVFGPADGAGEWGNDHVFEGSRFEGNLLGAMRLGSVAAILANNRFESNGPNGVVIAPQAAGTRVLTNFFSNNVVHDSGDDTKCALNIGLPNEDCSL